MSRARLLGGLLLLGIGASGVVGSLVRVSVGVHFDGGGPENFSLALVACAFVGTIARFLILSWAGRPGHDHLPLGTIAVNVFGTLCFALFWHATTESPGWRAALLKGFCGAFTTFSTFAFETWLRAREGRIRLAAANVSLQNLLGLCSVAATPGLAGSGPVHFPITTLIVNMSGCFAFGVLWAACKGWKWNVAFRAIVLTGFMGGLTTFSSYGFESGQLAAQGAWTWFAVNVLGQNLIGLLLMDVGVRIGGRLENHKTGGVAAAS